MEISACFSSLHFAVIPPKDPGHDKAEPVKIWDWWDASAGLQVERRQIIHNTYPKDKAVQAPAWKNPFHIPHQEFGVTVVQNPSHDLQWESVGTEPRGCGSLGCFPAVS